jgi:two-component system alkaline phosphatase synthesis response regulator PhoP
MKNTDKIRIYCVEDDDSIRELILYALSSAGYEAAGFDSAAPFFEALEEGLPALVLLDLMLPGEDGIQILKALRASAKTAKVPVVILTAKGSEYDKIIGLDTGADDYVTKPFGVMELLSRIRAILRRSEFDTVSTDDEAAGIPAMTGKDEISCADITVNRKKRSVTSYGQECVLTYKEFELLWHLMENKEIVLTREQLLSAVWGIDFEGETRTVDMHIKTLRQKLGKGGEAVKTLRGVGYKISS